MKRTDLPRLLEIGQGIAEEIVVVEFRQHGRTLEIAAGGRRASSDPRLTNYAEQKKLCCRQASEYWILLLDADEELSEELRASILNWKARPRNYEMAAAFV